MKKNTLTFAIGKNFMFSHRRDFDSPGGIFLFNKYSIIF